MRRIFEKTLRDFKELIKGEKSYVLIPSLGTIHMTLETILGIQEDVKNLRFLIMGPSGLSPAALGVSCGGQSCHVSFRNSVVYEGKNNLPKVAMTFLYRVELLSALFSS